MTLKQYGMQHPALIPYLWSRSPANLAEQLAKAGHEVYFKYLDNVSDQDFVKLEITSGIAFVYEFDAEFTPVKHYNVRSTHDSGGNRSEAGLSL
jgi:hypothetical protein